MKSCAILLVFLAATLFSIVLSGALPATVVRTPNIATAIASAVSSRSTDFVTTATPTASPIDLVTPTTDNLSSSTDAAFSRVTYISSSTSVSFSYTTVSDSNNDAARNGVDKNEYVAILVFMAVGVPLALLISLWFISKCLRHIRDQGR
ncbi:hypothetical protein NA56DRAFT_728863 [Hyaloscypha hepaticicola]|uniref:Mid2 domain-containing protein n=1 Tax=Hyaloscypha hepaticicola TaxID=2082293 RepID=A0A2J6PTC0_9HELO|nr:hypothetical protein NA56DRAFT_728863 [Hyaloscypha hepaticicola]